MTNNHGTPSVRGGWPSEEDRLTCASLPSLIAINQSMFRSAWTPHTSRLAQGDNLISLVADPQHSLGLPHQPHQYQQLPSRALPSSRVVILRPHLPLDLIRPTNTTTTTIPAKCLCSPAVPSYRLPASRSANPPFPSSPVADTPKPPQTRPRRRRMF